MGISYNPRIVTDGLVLALDAGNTKGFDDDENLTPYSNEHTNSYWASPPNGGVGSLPTITLEGSNSLGNYYRWTKTSSPWVTGFFGSHFPDVSSGSVTISFNIKWGGGITNLRWYGYNNVTGTCTNQIDINSSSGVDIGDSWRKVTMTFTATNSTNRWFIEITGTGYWLMQNIQSELSTTASPYYATTGTAKNRGTTLIDMTGRGNNGTLLNGPTSSTDNGGVLNLDGSNDYINSYNDSNLFVDDNSLTVSIFANINEASKTGRGGLVSSQRYQGEPDPGGYGLCIFDGTQLCVNLTKRILGVDNSYEGLCAFTYIRQQFKYYSFTYNNSTKTVTTYMNGVQQATSTNASYGWTLNTTNRITRIGINWQGGWGTYYNMKIGAVHIHNRALSAAEIQQNFNTLRGRYGI